jgi:hypothetical protein
MTAFARCVMGLARCAGARDAGISAARTDPVETLRAE